MAVRSPREEQATLLQEAGDRGDGVEDRGAREGAEAFQVAALGIHGRDDGEPVPAAEVEVLESAARRDVDEPGAVLGRHLVPGDHAVLDALLGG